MIQNGVGVGQDEMYNAKMAAEVRRRDYQRTELLEIAALPGGFIVHARDDHGERNRRQIVSSPEALVAAVQRWAKEATEK